MKTIIFDLSEVLLTGLFGADKLIERRLGTNVPYKALEVPELSALFRGEISEETYWHSVIERNGWQIGIGELKRAVRENFREMPGTRTVVKRLKIKGYRLGLLSVHAKEWVHDLESRFTFERLFDSLLYSFDTGLLKPDARAFHGALDKMKTSPANIIFIDDMRKNVQTAAELGITGIYFTDADALISHLEFLQVL